MITAPGYFHLHLISDSTGETLITVARAAAAQYSRIMPVEHVHPLVRTQKQLATRCPRKPSAQACLKMIAPLSLQCSFKEMARGGRPVPFNRPKVKS